MIRTILSDLFRGIPSTFLFCSCPATDISNAFDGESGLKNYFTFRLVCPMLIDKKAVSGRIPSSVSTSETYTRVDSTTWLDEQFKMAHQRSGSIIEGVKEPHSVSLKVLR